MTETLADLNAGRVLVVEDDVAVARVLSTFLNRSGFKVDVATNGADALRAVVQTMPDVVVLDWMLPDVTGVEVCRQIKTVPATRHIPVAMITGHNDNAHRQEGLDAGASEFLGKPFSRETLVSCVQSLVRVRRGAGRRTSGALRRVEQPIDRIALTQFLDEDVVGRAWWGGGRTICVCLIVRRP